MLYKPISSALSPPFPPLALSLHAQINHKERTKCYGEKNVFAKSRQTGKGGVEIGGTRERNLHEILLCWGIFDVLIEMPRALLICRRTLALFINKCFNFKTATKALHARELQIPFAQRLQHAQLTRNMKMTEKKGTATTTASATKAIEAEASHSSI